MYVHMLMCTFAGKPLHVSPRHTCQVHRATSASTYTCNCRCTCTHTRLLDAQESTAHYICTSIFAAKPLCVSARRNECKHLHTCTCTRTCLLDACAHQLFQTHMPVCMQAACPMYISKMRKYHTHALRVWHTTTGSAERKLLSKHLYMCT